MNQWFSSLNRLTTLPQIRQMYRVQVVCGKIEPFLLPVGQIALRGHISLVSFKYYRGVFSLVCHVIFVPCSGEAFPRAVIIQTEQSVGRRI